MKIFIDDYQAISDQPIVRTEISPADVLRFRQDSPSIGMTSIIHCGPTLPKECENGTPFTLAPNQLAVLNVGSTPKTYLMFDHVSGDQIDHPACERDPNNLLRTHHSSGIIRGDEHFRKSLPSHLKALGLKFLEMIRERFVGELIFHPKSRRFVESPNNFWAVVIQPRDKSLRVTVKGRPNAFVIPSDLELKRDQSSYSAFKVKEDSQLASAVQIITKAASN